MHNRVVIAPDLLLDGGRRNYVIEVGSYASNGAAAESIGINVHDRKPIAMHADRSRNVDGGLKPIATATYPKALPGRTVVPCECIAVVPKSANPLIHTSRR